MRVTKATLADRYVCCYCTNPPGLRNRLRYQVRECGDQVYKRVGEINRLSVPYCTSLEVGALSDSTCMFKSQINFGFKFGTAHNFIHVGYIARGILKQTQKRLLILTGKASLSKLSENRKSNVIGPMKLKLICVRIHHHRSTCNHTHSCTIV